MEARRRNLVLVERQNFQGWVCSECAWVFNPSGPPAGESIDEMKANYQQRRDKEFTTHACAEYPKPRKIPVSQMRDLDDPEVIASLGLLHLLDLLQRGATMERPFDILKKTDVVSFEWVKLFEICRRPRPGSKNYKPTLPATTSSLVSAQQIVQVQGSVAG